VFGWRVLQHPPAAPRGDRELKRSNCSNAGNLRGSQVLENMERETGLEPATSSLGSWHSTTELLPRSSIFRYLTVRQ
jgi:hypothetical protein